jgi:TetR/AcrR family transcriptional repressor of lmrAB and yxaGH operons
MADTREKILITMARLIEKQGYHATGLNEIIRESGAPKGSVYYFFPGGKEQIGAEAILESGKIISERLIAMLGAESDPAEAIQAFMLKMAENMVASGYNAGSPLTTATIETAMTSETINIACRQAFDMILSAVTAKFVESGTERAEAENLALFITTVIEGGILMSRTYQSAEPLKLAARHMHSYLRGR